MLGRKAKGEPNYWVIALIAVAVIGFNVGGAGDWVKGIFSGADAIPTKGGETPKLCIYDGATLTIGGVTKKYAPTTALTGFGHRLIVNGFDKGLQTDGSSVDVNPDDDVSIFYASNSSDNYYAAEQTFTVPCTSSLASGMNSDIDPNKMHEVILGKLPVISFFNDDDGLKNSDTNNETMAASDSANIEMKVVFSANTGYSPFGDRIVCIRGNSTLFEDYDLSAVSGVTGGVSTTGDLDVISNHNQFGSATNFEINCWKVEGGFHGDKTLTEMYNIYLETATGHTPAATGGTGDNSDKAAVNVSMWDEDWYRDSEDGLMKFGFQDDTDADEGMMSTANGTILIRS